MVRGGLGCERPAISEAPPVDVARPCFRGEPTTAGSRQAILRWRDTEIQLIQPDSEPSRYVYADTVSRLGSYLELLEFDPPAPAG